jgi:hypothetical protein
MLIARPVPSPKARLEGMRILWFLKPFTFTAAQANAFNALRSYYYTFFAEPSTKTIDYAVAKEAYFKARDFCLENRAFRGNSAPLLKSPIG